jgi:hypothetical protein
MIARTKPLALAVLIALTAASAALAGKLPGDGDWSYDSASNMKSAPGYVVFKAYLRVDAGKASVYSLSAIVLGGTCKMKNGTIVKDSLVGGDVVRTQIAVKPDGSFVGTRTARGDTGGKGSLTVRGVFTGARVSGTVTAHMHDPNWGDCRGTGKFVRAKGVRIA